MPYVELQTTTVVAPEMRDTLRHELAHIIELVPGKSERWVMTHIEDQAVMSFAGSADEPAAAIILKTFGELDNTMYDMLTKEFCSRISKMIGVAPDRLYVIYEPIAHWGWDGGNF